MTSPAPRAAERTLSQTVDVETPELVVFSYTVAGIGSRAYAAIIDYLLCAIIMLALWVVGAMLRVGARFGGASPSEAWALALLVLFQFAVLWGYYLLFEALWDGQTPGKRSQRLRVVRDGGYSVTFGASAVRNLVRVIDMQPVFFYGVGLFSALFSKSGKRLGDIVAGTIVVREEIVPSPTVAPAAARSAPAEEAAPIHTALTEAEYAFLSRFLERRATLDAARQQQLVAQVAGRLRHVLPGDDDVPVLTRLSRLHAAEQLARARGVGARNATGAARERHAIVAAGSERWSRFATRLADAQSRGLSALGEDGLRDFVAEYRALSADLARLRTATRGATEPEVFYLSRLVAGAHNLLYRRGDFTLWQVARFMFVEMPAEVRRSWRPILLAALLLFGPGAIAWRAVVRDESVARTFIPPSMIERAELGVERARNEEGYIPDPQVFRPVMATRILANNVQVSFMAFAGGITAGVLTVWVLVSNGVSLGGVTGLYAAKGIGKLLLAFVAPHGVLELSAICISAGAGLLLAAAILIPGARTRRRALVENARRAVRLVAVATLLLVVAGFLEGLVSPIPWWPLEGKLAVAGVTAVLLYAYLRGGARRRVAVAPDETPDADLLALGADPDQMAPRALSSR